MSENIDELIEKIKKNNADENRNLAEKLKNNLSAEQKAVLDKLMSDKALMQKLLNNGKAAEIMKKISGGNNGHK